MKQQSFFAMLLWSSLQVSAQITVPASTFPVAGDVLHYTQAANPSAAIALFTPPGGGQNWDLSALTPALNVESSFRPAAEGVHQAAFPEAAMVVFKGAEEHYYRSTATKFELLGYLHAFLPNPLHT